MDKKNSGWLVLHVPHASTVIPEGERKKLLATREELDRELLRLTDWFMDELFAVEDSRVDTVVFPVSRLVVDVERFLDDSMEQIRARWENGAIRQPTSAGTEQADRDG